MAIYRNIQMSFWTDSKVVDDYTPEDRYFYLYLLTNPHTNLCGCYEISIKQMSDETGYTKETIEKLLKRMAEVHNSVYYSYDTKEILLTNWHKYNWTKSEKFRKPVSDEINNIKNNTFKTFLTNIFSGSDTVSIPYQYGSDTTVSVSVTDTVTVTDTVNNNNLVTDIVPEPEPIKHFETFWNNYPRKVHKGMAEREYVNLILDGVKEEWLVDAAKEYAMCKRGTAEQYIKNPENWLKENLYLEYPPGTYENQEKAKKEIKGTTEQKPQQKKNTFNNFPQRQYSKEESLSLEQQLLRASQKRSGT